MEGKNILLLLKLYSCTYIIRGQYGIIKKCLNKLNGSLVAAKYLKHSNKAIQEVKILQDLSPFTHVLEFIDSIITEDYQIVIVTELYVLLMIGIS